MYLNVDQQQAFVYTANRPLRTEQKNVVFVHGASHDHSVWALQSRYFAYHGWNAFAVDLPGHGRSAGPLLSSIEAMADWLTRLLDAAKIERASVVGHSMGSLIALDCALRHSTRVEKIALIGTSVPMPVGAGLLNAAQANDHAAFDMVTIWGHRSRTGGNPNPGMWLIGHNLRLNERAAAGVLHNDLNACNAFQLSAEQAADITCAALIVSGERDMMTPAKAARAIAQALPHSRSLTMQAGHALMVEQPDAVLDALIQFL